MVGLAIGKVLSEEFEDVVIVEKEKSFGRHTSSRNSEVLHSGIYYPQNTLKAKFCVEGLELIYSYLREREIPHRQCGKFIVASSEEEKGNLFNLKENAEKNGVTGLTIISKEEVQRLDPKIKCYEALFVPSTGIVDSHKLMAQLETDFEGNDGFTVYDMEVTDIKHEDDKYIVHFSNGEVFQTNYLINSAGLYADKISAMLGITNDQKSESLSLHWCKGEYYKSNTIKDIKHLIYPLPDPKGVFLGIHLTINLNNEVRFGPNAYYVNEIDYKMDESYKDDFYKAISRYIDVKYDELHLDDCGIRPKLQNEGEEFRDFYVQEETINGFPNFVNLIGIESPGLTSCLVLGQYVKKIIKG